MRLTLALAAVSLYAGFRLNEATGVSTVLLREARAVAEPVLLQVNAARAVPVTLVMASVLVALGVAARSRRVAAAAGLFAADQLVTWGLHVPLVLQLRRGEVTDWHAFSARWVADDIGRTALLLAAAGLLVSANVAGHGRPEPS